MKITDVRAHVLEARLSQESREVSAGGAEEVLDRYDTLAAGQKVGCEPAANVAKAGQQDRHAVPPSIGAEIGMIASSPASPIGAAECGA